MLTIIKKLIELNMNDQYFVHKKNIIFTTEQLEYIVNHTQFLDVNARITERCHCLLYGKTESNKCIVCGKPTNFLTIKRGYVKTCSNKCGKINPETKEKTKNTNLLRYGIKNPFSDKKKIKESYRKKLGVDNPMQLESVKNKSKTAFLESIYFRFMEKIKENDFIPLFDINEWIQKLGSSGTYKWKCQICNTTFEDKPYYNFFPRCPICKPHTVSSLEQKVCQFLDANKISYKLHDRKILLGKELDILIDNYPIAIELDGLYWHTEKFIFKRTESHDKYLHCQKKGIQLLRFFEDEIINENKFDIIKSMILHRLNKTENKIFARKCTIEELTKQESKIFLEENHLQGYRNSKYNIALKYNDQIVAIVTINKGSGAFIAGTTDKYEIVRFAVKKYFSVVGGYNKLINYVYNKYSKQLYTYVDLRYTDINNYQHNWMIETKPTIGYYYYDGKKRLHRYNFTKYRLIKLCQSKNIIVTGKETEVSLSEKLGLERIYDSGQLKLTFKKQNN